MMLRSYCTKLQQNTRTTNGPSVCQSLVALRSSFLVLHHHRDKTTMAVSNTVLPGDSDRETPLLQESGEEHIRSFSDRSEASVGPTGEMEEDHDSSYVNGPSISVRQIFTLLLSPVIDEQGNAVSIIMGLISIFFCGSLLGLVMPKDSKFPTESYATVSSCLGFTYFFAWSVSFYPQVITNFRRRTTSGLSVEFCSLNVLGFTYYSIFNLALYGSSSVQALYRERYGQDAQIPVQSNDVAFAIHALTLSCITLFQILCYDGIHPHQMSPFILALIGTLVVVGVVGALLSALDNSFFNWLDYIYVLSLCKIIVTLVKYMPQVILNWKRRSTRGWVSTSVLLKNASSNSYYLLFSLTRL